MCWPSFVLCSAPVGHRLVEPNLGPFPVSHTWASPMFLELGDESAVEGSRSPGTQSASRGAAEKRQPH